MKLLLTIPFTIYIWFCIGSYSKVFCQNILPCNTEQTCIKQKQQYLDYSNFILNKSNSDEFNTDKTNNPTKYLQLNNWFIDFRNSSLDSFSQSAFKLTGSELEINVENWKLEDNTPQFLIGNIQRNITNTLGLYEWRVKFDDFFALAALSSISSKKRFYYSPIDYDGNTPNQLSSDSWHYFPVNESNTVLDYSAFQCKDSLQNIHITQQQQDKNQIPSSDCKACNCRQSICFEEQIHDKYHTLSLVLTAESAAFFIDGALIYVNMLGGNDTRSICPLSDSTCAKNSVLSLSSGVVQNGDDRDFALRNDMWNYLVTGNEVKWTIDYFRKYDLKNNHMSSDNYLKSYQQHTFSIDTKNHKLSRKSSKMSSISDSLLVLVSKKNELILMDKNKKLNTIIDHQTKETIIIEGDFITSPEGNIFFVNVSGYIEILQKDSLGNFHKKALTHPNPIQRVKNTNYQDIAFLKNQGEIEIIFKTRKNSIGRYFRNRGRWYFIEMTSRAAIRIEGDIMTGTNGKIFYRGSDGYLHGMQVKGKNRQSFHINVRPLGSKTPRVSKAVGAFVITNQDEVIYVNTDNQLIHFYLETNRYKIKALTKKSKLRCEQVAGNLVWMNTPEIKQLLFFDKNNQLCGLKYNSNNKSWSLDLLSSIGKKIPKSRFKRTYSIVYNTSKVIHLSRKNQLLFYQLTPSSIKINDHNYALYIDETNECQSIKTRGKQILDKSNQRLSDF